MLIKRSVERKTTRENAERCFLYAPVQMAGKMMDILKNLMLECIEYPPYSPDLTLFHYFLFPKLKMKFSNDLEVIAAAE